MCYSSKYCASSVSLVLGTACSCQFCPKLPRSVGQLFVGQNTTWTDQDQEQEEVKCWITKEFFLHCEKKYENRVKYKGVKKLLVWFWLWAALEVKMSECYWQGWILQMQWIAWFVRLDWQIFWCNTFSRVIEHNQCDLIKIAISSELQNKPDFQTCQCFWLVIQLNRLSSSDIQINLFI